MKIVEGLLDYSEPWSIPDVYLFTGNSTIKNNGGIVMGRGAAKQVRDTYSGIDRRYGMALSKERADDVYKPHLMWVAIQPKMILGWFKVKHHWKDPADVVLIARSALDLAELATKHSKHIFHMNFPGIGNGQLEEENVLPLLRNLPDNVLIYK